MASENLNNIGQKKQQKGTWWKWFYFKANSHLSKSSETHTQQKKNGEKKNMKVEIYEESE